MKNISTNDEKELEALFLFKSIELYYFYFTTIHNNCHVKALYIVGYGHYNIK